MRLRFLKDPAKMMVRCNVEKWKHSTIAVLLKQTKLCLCGDFHVMKHLFAVVVDNLSGYPAATTEDVCTSTCCNVACVRSIAVEYLRHPIQLRVTFERQRDMSF